MNRDFHGRLLHIGVNMPDFKNLKMKNPILSIMIISERIIKVIKERNMTQAEFAKLVGISTSTISEWKKRKTNPSVEKIMDICNVLQITP